MPFLGTRKTLFLAPVKTLRPYQSHQNGEVPAELVKVHAALDKAVDAAYGYKGGRDDASRVSFLFDLYPQLSAPLDVAGTAKAKKPCARKTVA